MSKSICSVSYPHMLRDVTGTDWSDKVHSRTLECPNCGATIRYDRREPYGLVNKALNEFAAEHEKPDANA
jgi:hypothetical protein